MVYNPEGKKGEGQEWILVNPRIVSTGKGLDTMAEGCLSFQDISKDMYITGRITVSSFTCYSHPLCSNRDTHRDCPLLDGSLWIGPAMPQEHLLQVHFADSAPRYGSQCLCGCFRLHSLCC